MALEAVLVDRRRAQLMSRYLCELLPAPASFKVAGSLLASFIPSGGPTSKDTVYKCIVTIDGLVPTRRWWVARCTQCKHTTILVPSSSEEPEKYRCSDTDCACTQAKISYRLSLLGSDITGEAIFVLEEEIAQSIVAGSPQQVIMNNSAANLPLNNMAASAAELKHTPPEIAAIVSWKFKFAADITPSCFRESLMQFNVRAIEVSTPPADM